MLLQENDLPFRYALFIRTEGPEDELTIARFADGSEIAWRGHEFTDVSSETVDDLISLYILEQFQRYQKAEVSDSFEVNIAASAYASARGVEIKFNVGEYSSRVTTYSLAQSTSVWLARRAVDEALAPKRLTAA